MLELVKLVILIKDNSCFFMKKSIFSSSCKPRYSEMHKLIKKKQQWYDKRSLPYIDFKTQQAAALVMPFLLSMAWFEASLVREKQCRILRICYVGDHKLVNNRSVIIKSLKLILIIAFCSMIWSYDIDPVCMERALDWWFKCDNSMISAMQFDLNHWPEIVRKWDSTSKASKV